MGVAIQRALTIRFCINGASQLPQSMEKMSYLYILLEQRRKDLEQKEEMRHAQILEKESLATPPSPNTEEHPIPFILKGREPNEEPTASISTGSFEEIHSHSTS